MLGFLGFLLLILTHVKAKDFQNCPGRQAGSTGSVKNIRTLNRYKITTILYHETGVFHNTEGINTKADNHHFW